MAKAVTLICVWPFSVFTKNTRKWWKWHTDAEYADEIVKLQREFDRQFQDFHNLESGIKITLEVDIESVPVKVQMEQWLLIVGTRIPGSNQYINTMDFQRARAFARFRTWKVWSINLPIDRFAFTVYFKSGDLKQRTITTNHFSEVLSQYCLVVKTYKPIWLYRTRNDMYVDHTPKLFRKRPRINE